MVTTNFLVPLRYDTLDITGAATTPGSYAFLKTAGDASSAIGNFSDSSLRSVELRVHTTDASGASRADFYDMVQVGDMFDYRTDNGGVCMVPLQGDEHWDDHQPKNVWHRAGHPVQDMVSAVRRRSRRPPERADSYGACAPALLVQTECACCSTASLSVREPIESDNYWPWVIDVPAGMTIVYHGVAINELDVNRPNQPASTLVLEDVDTGSVLHIDPSNGHTGQIYIIGPHPSDSVRPAHRIDPSAVSTHPR